MSDFNTLFILALLLESKEIEQKFLSKVEGYQSVCMGEMRDYLRSEVAKRMETLQKKNADPVRSEICDLLFNAIRITAYVFKNSIHPDADLNRLELEVEEIKAGFFLSENQTNEGSQQTKASELVDMINKERLNTPYEVDEMEDIGDVEMITAVDQSEHRWYCLGTVVFRAGEEYFGVNGPVSLKSESMSYSDVGYKCEAFLMERVPSFTYKQMELKNHEKAE